MRLKIDHHSPPNSRTRALAKLLGLRALAHQLPLANYAELFSPNYAEASTVQKRSFHPFSSFYPVTGSVSGNDALGKRGGQSSVRNKGMHEPRLLASEVLCS